MGRQRGKGLLLRAAMEETQATMYWIKQELETKKWVGVGREKRGARSLEMVRDIWHILGEDQMDKRGARGTDRASAVLGTWCSVG